MATPTTDTPTPDTSLPPITPEAMKTFQPVGQSKPAQGNGNGQPGGAQALPAITPEVLKTFKPVAGGPRTLGTPQTSTAQQGGEPSTWQNIKEGLKQSMAGQLAQSAFGLPQDANEVGAHAGGGDFGLFAYRQAKNLIGAHEAMQKATGEAYQKALDNFRSAVLDYVFSSDHDPVMSGKKHDAMMHAVSGGANLAGALMPGAGAPLSEAADIAEGSTAEKNLATPLTRGAADLATLGATAVLPKVVGAMTREAGGAEEAAEAGETATPKAKVTNPVEATVTKNVAKAKLPAGENLAEEAQTHLEESTANEVNRIADSNGVPRPKPGPAHQMQREVADSIYKRSKAEYAQVDAKTGGKFQPNADKVANVNNKLRDIAGTDEEKEAELQATKTRLLWQQDQIFAEAEKNGLPKETVAKAKNDFHTAQAQYDLSNNLRASAPGDNPNALDATKMRNRMNKMNITEEGGKPGRLTQAVGKESAANLEENAHAVQFMSQLPATEEKALTEMVGAHTKTSLLRGGATDWKGVMDDFDALKPAEQKARFADSEAVRNFLKAQARKQLVTKWGTRAAVTAGAGTVWHEAGQL